MEQFPSFMNILEHIKQKTIPKRLLNPLTVSLPKKVIFLRNNNTNQYLIYAHLKLTL